MSYQQQKTRKSRRKFVQKRQKGTNGDRKRNKRAVKFAKRFEEDEIDRSRFFKRLKRGVLNYNNEVIILETQDEGLLTNGLKKIFNITANDKCRFCQDSFETVNHLLSDCL